MRPACCPWLLQVCWQVDELQKSLQFVSVSLDGVVVLWTLAKAELQRRLVVQQQAAAEGTDGAAAPSSTASGTCIDFNKVQRGLSAPSS